MGETLVDQVQSPELSGALRSLITQAKTVNQELQTQQPLDATGLRIALDAAAKACQQGGFVITWYHG